MKALTLPSLNTASEIDRIADWLRKTISSVHKKRGLVIAISGGIDSAVCAALCVRAVGPKRTYGLLLPERDSSPKSTSRGRMVAEQLGSPSDVVDIADTLEAIGCYSQQQDAVKAVFPDYEPDWKFKIALAHTKDGGFSRFHLVVETADGTMKEEVLPLAQYLKMLAATNYKQRIRKTLEYGHADRLNYAVVGTPNRLEYDLGFFVRNADGSADVKPIAHLYKSQVYELAHALNCPEEIINARPSTDTYSLSQGQDEFYFGLPLPDMDLALYGYHSGESAARLASSLGVDEDEASRLYREIEAKLRSAKVLLQPSAVISDSAAE